MINTIKTASPLAKSHSSIRIALIKSVNIAQVTIELPQRMRNLHLLSIIAVINKDRVDQPTMHMGIHVRWKRCSNRLNINRLQLILVVVNHMKAASFTALHLRSLTNQPIVHLQQVAEVIHYLPRRRSEALVDSARCFYPLWQA